MAETSTAATPPSTPARGAPWRAEIAGGSVSAAAAVPLAIGYGMFAFVALGDRYFTTGVLAGLVSAFVLGIVNVALGDRTTTVYAPRVVTTFALGAILAQNLLPSDARLMVSADAALVITIMLLIVLLAGFFQFSFGLLRVGSLLKHTPHPVMAGFQNAAALLLALVQTGNIIGLDYHVPLTRILHYLGATKPLNVAVAACTCVVMWNAKRLLPKVPPLISGLVAGCVLYYALVAVGLEEHLGPVIGEAPPLQASLGHVFAIADLVQRPDLEEIAWLLLGGSLSIAVIASIDTLLCARLLEVTTRRRPGDNRQLMRMGAANMVAAGLGGITGGVNLGPSMVNHAFGGRTLRSVLVNAAWIGATMLALLPILGALPRVVLSAAILVIAIQHFDPWTTGLLRRLAERRGRGWENVIGDLTVVLIVAVTAIAADLVVAVVFGVAITIVFFLLRMSRNAVRRAYRLDEFHSRRARDPAAMEILAREGHRVLVIELEGPLFFGTAEKLEQFTEAVIDGSLGCVIMDIERVNELDATGAATLIEINDRLARDGCELVLSGHGNRAAVADQLREHGVIAALPDHRAFADLDRALEWAEDRLLLAELGTVASPQEFPLEQLDVFAGLGPEQIARVAPRVVRHSYKRGDILVREGEVGRDLYIIAKGTASAYLNMTGEGRPTRLITFTPGTVFGELALLDEETRSATVQADGFLVCYVLSREAFESLAADEPAIAIRLLANLGRELSVRLRRANRAICHLSL